MDLVFYVSEIKSDVNGSHASQVQYNFGHHVNMQLIKIPRTSYVNNIEGMGGMISQGIGGIFKPLSQ